MLERGEEGEEARAHSMQNGVSMAEFKTAEDHGHPAFDICRQKDQRTVLDDHLEVSVEELEHKIQIGL
jgi:hypothetical protein